jgi:hypothetical protein
MDEEWYQNKSTQEHVIANADLRALIPPHAQYHPYELLQIKDSWVVPDSLAETIAWYRKITTDRRMKPTLHQCTPGSIWGGWVVIIDYCSTENYARVVLGQDTTLGATSVEVQYTTRRPSFQCDDPLWNEYRAKNTQNCPLEFIP